MSRLATIPYEVGLSTSTDYGRQGDGTAEGGAVPTLSSATVRTGATALSCASGAGGSTSYSAYRLLAGDVALGRGYWYRIYINLAQLPPSGFTPPIIRALGQNASTFLADVNLTSGGALQLWNWGANAQVGSNSTALVTGVWYRVELYLKMATGANDEMELRLDGVSVAAATGLTVAEVAPGYWRAGWIGGPGTSRTIYIDDMAVNDDQGASQNSWPGAGNIVWAQPVSDNARAADWLAGAGGTTNLYDALNNAPPVGVALASATNTSQVKNAGTSATSNLDLNVQDYATAGVPASATITLVQAFVDRGISASANDALQIVSNPAQATEDTSAPGLGAAGTWPSQWQTLVGTAQVGDIAAGSRGTQPVLRYGKRSTSANSLMADAAGLYVEYVPAPAPFPPWPPRANSLLCQ